MFKKKKLFCVLGETCSDKNTIIAKVCQQNPEYQEVCSYTTRPKRQNEVDGIDHYFLTQDEFTSLRYEQRENVLSYTKIASEEYENGYEYMTLLNELEKKNIYTIDPRGLEYLKTHFSEKLDIVTIYIFAPYEQRKNRALTIRKDTLENFENRVKAEHKQFDIFRNAKDFDYILYNFDGQLDNCVGIFESILNYESHERDVMSEEVVGKNIDIHKQDLSNAIGIIKDMGDYYQRHATNTFIAEHYEKYMHLTTLVLLDKLTQL